MKKTLNFFNMKTKSVFMGLTLSLFVLALTVSCEKDKSITPKSESNEVVNELTDAQLSSYIDVNVKKKTFLQVKVKEETSSLFPADTFELWYASDFPYGIVTVYDDGIDLFVKYELYKEFIDAGWTFLYTYLFVGDYVDLPMYGSEDAHPGTVNWHATDVEGEYTDGPVEIIRTIPLEDLDECFGIATKAKIDDPMSDFNPNPRALMLSETGKGSYPWEEEYKYCVETCDGPGTGTQGYWHKVSHWEDWGIEAVTIGGITYTAEEATELIKKPGRGDKTYDMYAQLVAAKLNVMIGNCDYCISDVIASADAWMVDNPVGSGVSADSPEWKEAEEWHYLLDEYNNGRLCAPHRD